MRFTKFKEKMDNIQEFHRITTNYINENLLQHINDEIDNYNDRYRNKLSCTLKDSEIRLAEEILTDYNINIFFIKIKY